MSDLLALFKVGCALFGSRVHAVRADQWSLGTPCAEWDVATLVDHVVDEHLWVPPLVGGHDLATAGGIVESVKRTLGPDRVAAWDDAALDSQRAFGEPGALDRDDCVSPRRQRGARHDARGLARPDRLLRCPSRRDLLDDAQGQGGGEVRGTDRVAVHEGLVVRRRVDVADDILGEDQAERGRSDRDHFRRSRRYRFKDQGLRFRNA